MNFDLRFSHHLALADAGFRYSDDGLGASLSTTCQFGTKNPDLILPKIQLGFRDFHLDTSGVINDISNIITT